MDCNCFNGKKLAKPEMVKLKKISKETPTTTTYYLDYDIAFEPGQFVMLWLPGIDEKPFVIAYKNGKELGITIQRRGKFSQEFEKLKKGSLIGIRGPFGNTFETKNVKNAIIISGGSGTATINLLVDKLLKQKAKVRCIIGARTKNELLMEKILAKKTQLFIATDDGSKGTKGYNTQELEKQILKEKPDCVFGCGPELMMAKAFKFCEKRKIKCQMSLERVMKCGGMGICGACEIDGILVCIDGPVFNNSQLKKMPGFGTYTRDKSAKKILY